jgi:hypothetical protein
MRVAMLGHRGFIGSTIAERLRMQGAAPEVLPRLVLPERPLAEDDTFAAAHRWLSANPAAARDWVAQLKGVDVVVNAAGRADPSAQGYAALWTANALLPTVLAYLCAHAQVSRFVHVSSAAVQGRRDPLDESSDRSPFSDYSRSKAAGEAGLLACKEELPPLVLYRATSVQGHARATSERLVRFANLPAVPIVTGPERPTPVAIAANVGAGIAYCALHPGEVPMIVLHPWEGFTNLSVLRLLALRKQRYVRLPLRPTVGVANFGWLVAQHSSRRAAQWRRVELLLLGQEQHCRGLASIGFVPPVPPESLRDIAESSRRR